MNISEAFKIVLDLAQDNVLDDKDCVGSEELKTEQARQIEALGMASDWVYNAKLHNEENDGDDESGN